MRESLPSITVRRGKQGFGTPIVHWMNGEMGEMARQMIAESDVIRWHFQMRRIKRLLASREMKYRESLLTWLLFTISMWGKEYI
jgi:hypothetical protein